MRFGRDERVVPDRPPGDFERARSLPAGGRLLEDAPRLLPPRPAVVRADRREPLGSLRDLGRVRSAELRQEPALGGEGDDPSGDEQDRGQRERALLDRAEVAACEICDEDRAQEQRESEPRTVAYADGVRLEVFRDAWQREADGRDPEARGQRGYERGDALLPLDADREPRGHYEHGDDDSRARVREEEGDESEIEAERREVAPPGGEPEIERQRDVRQEGEAVPVPDRIAQARDARAVREERRHDLPCERPEQDRAEENAETQRDHACRPGRGGAGE